MVVIIVVGVMISGGGDDKLFSFSRFLYHIPTHSKTLFSAMYHY